MSDAMPTLALYAEKAVLGAILVGGDPAEALAVLRANDFHRSDHRRLFTKVEEFHRAGRPIDPISVATELAGLHGGIAYVVSLADGMPSRANVGEYARLVRDQADARQLIAVCQQAIKRLSADPVAIRNGIPGVLRLTLDQVAPLTQPEDAKLFLTARELGAMATEAVSWLAKPFLAAGCITELTGRAKTAGKTSLVLHLAACLLDGRSFLGEPTTQTPVVFLTEEAPTTFQQALHRAGLTERDDLHVLSFWQVGSRPWSNIVSLAVTRALAVGARLIVVDTLGKFAQFKDESENTSGAAEATLKPIHEAAAGHRLGFLLTRHERKGGGEVGEAGRGSSAFTGGADVVLSLQRPIAGSPPTVRALNALSRFEETPPTLMIERQIDSRQSRTELGENESEAARYVVIGTEPAVQARAAEDAILGSLPTTEQHAVTVGGIKVQHADIARRTLERALATLTESRRACRLGSGRKNSPYRYFRPVEASS